MATTDESALAVSREKHRVKKKKKKKKKENKKKKKKKKRKKNYKPNRKYLQYFQIPRSQRH